jgi:hypothetical protein
VDMYRHTPTTISRSSATKKNRDVGTPRTSWIHLCILGLPVSARQKKGGKQNQSRVCTLSCDQVRADLVMCPSIQGMDWKAKLLGVVQATGWQGGKALEPGSFWNPTPLT